MRTTASEKPLHWTGSSKKDFLKFPRDVIKDFGFALGVVQLGLMPPSSKPLFRTFGNGVHELIEETGDAFRVVYSLHFEEAVYVLHCFQKKSKSGIAIPKVDTELVKERLKTALRDHEKLHGKNRQTQKKS